MKCFVCGKEFVENEIKGIKYDDLKKTGLVKSFECKGVIYQPCQNCLLPFAKGIILGRNSVGVGYDYGTFKEISE